MTEGGRQIELGIFDAECCIEMQKKLFQDLDTKNCAENKLYPLLFMYFNVLLRGTSHHKKNKLIYQTVCSLLGGMHRACRFLLNHCHCLKGVHQKGK